MIGKPVALIQVPNQRLFSVRAAARYLGMHEQTLRKFSDLGRITTRRVGARRMFTLEELDRFIESLPEWYDPAGGSPRIPEGRT